MTDDLETEGFQAQNEAVLDLNAALEELSRTGQIAARSLSDVFAQSGADMQRAIGSATEEGQQALTRLSEAGAGLSEIGTILSDSLEQAARTGELRLSDMVRTISRSMAELALDQWVLAPLAQSFDAQTQSSSAPLASGFFAGLGGLFQSAFEGVLGHRELGGPVLAGEAYLVGERGPEIFSPHSAGTITPLAEAPPINITIQTQSSPVEAVRQSERQIAAALARAVQQGRTSL